MKNDNFKRCPVCGKTIPLQYPLIEYYEYWRNGHEPTKRKRGRPKAKLLINGEYPDDYSLYRKSKKIRFRATRNDNDL